MSASRGSRSIFRVTEDEPPEALLGVGYPERCPDCGEEIDDWGRCACDDRDDDEAWHDEG